MAVVRIVHSHKKMPSESKHTSLATNRSYSRRLRYNSFPQFISWHAHKFLLVLLISSCFRRSLSLISLAEDAINSTCSAVSFPPSHPLLILNHQTRRMTPQSAQNTSSLNRTISPFDFLIVRAITCRKRSTTINTASRGYRVMIAMVNNTPSTMHARSSTDWKACTTIHTNTLPLHSLLIIIFSLACSCLLRLTPLCATNNRRARHHRYFPADHPNPN